ncbi:MAG TPA: SHOCT domain-containing protein [Bacillota bacterium]|nr:SHOCT domain-containing protein [Bacillota bacterium]
MHWGWGFWWFPPFGFFILLFLLLGGIRFLFFRHRGPWRHWQEDPLALLKRRLAIGEITEAEYQRLKEILTH